MQIKKLTILLWLGFAHPAWPIAANAPHFEKLLAEIYHRCTEEVPYEVLEERLWERYHAPLELNQASDEALQALFILTEAQLTHFFKHVAQTGPLISIYDLQAIPSFDLPTIQRLVPFVKVVDTAHHTRAFWPKKLGSRDSYGLMRYERVLETKQGYLPNKKTGQVPYLGSPDGVLARLSIKAPSGWGIGLSTRIKAGEPLTWDPDTHCYGGTIQRFHWLLRRPGKNLHSLVVGDYAVGYGEGLVLHAGFSMGKSSETVKVIRTNNVGIRPHTALTSAAWRGVAATWQWQPIELTVYGSMVALDGKVWQDSEGMPYIKSLSRGGNYRTENEVAKKSQIQEQAIGSTVVYKSTTPGTVWGINALYTQYSLPIYPAAQRQRNPLCFRGQDHANASFFYRYLWQNFHFFGEGGLSTRDSLLQADMTALSPMAGVAGVVASLSRYLDATVLGRYYGQAFHAPYGNAFRENSSGNSNERGLYVGLSARPGKRFYLDAYYDYFYFPWFKGEARDGHSWLAKSTCQPRRDSLLSFQYKGKTKPHKPQIENGLKHHYKLRYKHTWSKAISLKSEVQWSSYAKPEKITRGYAAVQDVGYKTHRLQIKARAAWFSTDDHLNKLAFYEPNVLYSGFNFPAYQGRGRRYSLLVCYKPTAALRLEMKYALTHYRDRDQIGKNREAIAGNVKNEVKVQAMFRF